MRSDIDDERTHADAAQEHRAKASIERTVEWVDTDASGHQHNSAIMRWVEAAEAQLVRDLGLDDYFPAAPRVRQEINYRTKLWFGQPVTATVAVVKMGRSSMTYAFEVVGHPFAGHAGGTAADGTVTVVHVPVGSSTGSPWPGPMRAALAPDGLGAPVGIFDDVDIAST
ncbi:MAG TPA: thioesterase family protein [Micrococcaceae bacterium]|jgi:acyl-CoA thioester hydrolase|nr:thioesterase family protein [Micrococcaceae bacterium]